VLHAREAFGEKGESPRARPGGPTEEQVNMAGTVPQSEGKKGKTVEDLAGTGEQDSPGG